MKINIIISHNNILSQLRNLPKLSKNQKKKLCKISKRIRKLKQKKHLQIQFQSYMISCF